MTRVRRREVVDEYVEDGRVAVMSADGMVLVLSDLGGVAWQALRRRWTPVEAVAEALVRELGAPDEGAGAVEATEAALRVLAEHGLVELAPDR